MVFIVTTDVEMKPVSPNSMSNNRAIRREATTHTQQAMRIANESHDFIIIDNGIRMA